LETLSQGCRKLSNRFEMLLQRAGSFSTSWKCCCTVQETFQALEFVAAGCTWFSKSILFRVVICFLVYPGREAGKFKNLVKPSGFPKP
jgi:hypothetical protein